MFAYFGLILVLVSWAAGGYLLTKWHDTSLPTISRHAASNKTALRLFAAVLIGSGLLFYWWLVAWFTPHLGLNWLFVAVLTLTIGCQIVAALVPDTIGKQRLWHRRAAYTMAVLYLPLAALVITAPELPAIGRVICAFLAAYMIVTFALVVVLGKFKRQYLTFQALYIMAFQTLLLVGAYV